MITIVTTTYNREKLLQRTINSVLNQTYSDFEYLIINNGSTDNTQKIIDNFCKNDKRIRAVSYKQNRRDYEYLLEKYNLIKENINKKYFMQIDDDDFMELNTVNTLYNLITEYNADIASVGSMYVYPDESKKDKYNFQGVFSYNRIDAMKELLKREKFNAGIGGKLFKKEIYCCYDLPKLNILRDIHTAYRRYNYINSMVVSGEPLYYFYRHDKNMSGLDSAEQITPEKINQHLEANTMRTQWLSEHMPEIKDYVFYCELSFMISLYERIYRLEVKDCFEIANEMKDNLIRNITFLDEHNFCSEREKEILNGIKNDTRA